jgi:predicted small secreted protein
MKACFKAIIAGLVFVIVLSGCTNTLQGFGKDMEHSGQEIQKSVDKKSS